MKFAWMDYSTTHSSFSSMWTPMECLLSNLSGTASYKKTYRKRGIVVFRICGELQIKQKIMCGKIMALAVSHGMWRHESRNANGFCKFLNTTKAIFGWTIFAWTKTSIQEINHWKLWEIFIKTARNAFACWTTCGRLTGLNRRLTKWSG